MRSAVGWKKGRSVARRPTRVPSASSVAFTSAPVYTNAESHVSKGSISSDGLEEEDEICGYPSQDRDVLAKRPRAIAESSDEKSTSASPPTKKSRVKSSKCRTKDTDSESDSTSEVNEGITTWRYGGLGDEDENDDYACRSRSDSPSEVNEGITWRYGGPFDEDENDDYAYRSVVLGERFDISLKMTSPGGTATIIPPRTREPRVERPRHEIKDPRSKLPNGVDDNGDWYKKFIPTYKKWLGTRDKPWSTIDRDESIAALQVIWRAVYPHIDYVIDAECFVYHLATHRLDDWRSSIDNAAIDLFKSRYEDMGFSTKETVSDASKLLQNYRFMYAETGKTQKEYHGLFRSPFILALIAGHYDRISGAVRIPEFERAFSRDEKKLVKNLETRLRALDADSPEALGIAVKLDTMRMCQKGALAVEHALGIFAPEGGALFQRNSDKWTEKLRKYSDIIKQKLRPGSMEDIVLKACRFMDSSTNISSISVQVLNDSDDEEISSESER
ncbi:hypothetical protein BGY98DRAFT_1093785 [Russula aff. rugulosa BPL654]|nr:hypothetical protein BGY98DRAFT_1093785 [Russula aff. rugulosa BPL654]